MLGPADILVGGVLPGAAALLLRQVLLRAGSSDRVAWPVAVGVAYIVGQAALTAPLGSGAAGWVAGLPPAFTKFFSPSEASQWLPAAVVVAAIVAMLASGGRTTRYVALTLGALLAIGLPLRMLWGSVYTLSQWSTGEAIAWIASLAVLLFATGWLLTRQMSDATPRVALLRDWLPGLVMVGVAIVLATSGSLSYARLAGAVAAALLGAALGGAGIQGERRLGFAAAGPLVTTLGGGMLLLGYFFAEVTTANALLLLAALAATGLPLPTLAANGWSNFALRGALCLVLTGAAAGSAGVAFSKAMAAQAADPYANWKSE
ncbi:hypothetical protein [Botrimarina mediterranea]|uniref:Uncharacterized protein n=1 Tax=Botrimarina mediterranea TaxID=2528022 RepID=A0A518K331_9BACT|nr:hypothetical protein [Botrimarina mediterranea]QDV72187.1 hypothetical protein Spa11_03590 [Botrimarina mediterranea]QDV76730.1 hypothetical protein K2D_03110 [Planctomycetes bacterium K2D]